MKIFIILLIVLLTPVLCMGQTVALSMVPSHSTLDMETIIDWMMELKDLNKDSHDLAKRLRPVDFNSTDPTLQFFRNKIEVNMILTAAITTLLGLSSSCNNLDSIKELIFIYEKILRDDMIQAKIYSTIVKEHVYLATTATVIISATYSTFADIAEELRLQEAAWTQNEIK